MFRHFKLQLPPPKGKEFFWGACDQESMPNCCSPPSTHPKLWGFYLWLFEGTSAQRLLMHKRTRFWIKILLNLFLYLGELKEKSQEIDIRKKIFKVNSEHRRLLYKLSQKLGFLWGQIPIPTLGSENKPWLTHEVLELNLRLPH